MRPMYEISQTSTAATTTETSAAQRNSRRNGRRVGPHERPQPARRMVVERIVGKRIYEFLEEADHVRIPEKRLVWMEMAARDTGRLRDRTG